MRRFMDQSPELLGLVKKTMGLLHEDVDSPLERLLDAEVDFPGPCHDLAVVPEPAICLRQEQEEFSGCGDDGTVGGCSFNTGLHIIQERHVEEYILHQQHRGGPLEISGDLTQGAIVECRW